MGVIKEVRVNDVYDLLDVAYADGVIELDAYLKRVLSKALEWFGAQGISVFLRSGDSKTFTLAGCGGLLSNIPPDASIQEGEGIAGMAIADQKPRRLADIRNEADLADRGIQRREAIGSSLIVPLTTRSNGVIGVLNVARASTEVLFEETDLEAAESLGRQIALAVNNACAMVNANTRRRKLQLAMESVGFGLLIVNGDGTFAEFSPEVSTILGADPAQCEGWETFAPRVHSFWHVPLKQGLERTHKGMSHKCRVVDDIANRTYAVVMSPLHGSGAIIAINDITEHEKARESLDRVQRLAEIGQMTASIAHEIRNPLAGIKSAAAMILEDPSLATEFAGIIEKESTKLNHLCTEFLDFAKPLSLEFEPVLLSDVARNVLARHQAEFTKSQVEVELIVVPSEPTIFADPLRLEQVLRNLVLNAVQASQPGHSVVVTVTADGFRIQDQGCGMDTQFIDRLFTPFLTTKTNGTGLGLSMVRKIVDAHKAKVSVNSQPGFGTTFEINFGVADAA
jgi:signal transduction histidine kinase/putative methionine-R-sulfoxide reductase with GAF domain